MLLNPLQRAVRHKHGLPIMYGRFPLAGHAFSTLQNPQELYARARELGPLVWIDDGFGQGHALLYTSPASLQLFRDQRLDSAHFYENFTLLLGRSLMSTDGRKHVHMRKPLNRPFSPRGLGRAGISRITRDVMSDAIAAWRGRTRVQILPAARQAALHVIFRIIGVPSVDIPTWARQFRRYALSALRIPAEFLGSPNWIARRARD